MSSEWQIEGRRLVPLMPRLVPQTAFTLTANNAANIQAEMNANLPIPAHTGNKECKFWFFYNFSIDDTVKGIYLP